MLSYMDLIQQYFYLSTGWHWDNTYEHILATPRNLLHFPIPNGVKIIVSNRNTEYNYSSINISQVDALEGSLLYLSSSAILDKYYKPSKSLPIQDVLQGYRDILPTYKTDDSLKKKNSYLLYGKIYFPSQFLEGMLIKRFSPNYQLIVKFVNTPKLNKLTQPTSIFTFYLQRQTENSAHDFIYSTREDLFGFRCLYHFDMMSANSQISPINKALSSKFRSNSIKHPSKLSAGCELWYAAGNVSPGVSIAARYTTYIDSMRYLMDGVPIYTAGIIDSDMHPYLYGQNLIRSIPYAISNIHPLTFTIAANPLLGTFESTYAIRSDVHFKDDARHNDPDISYTGKMGIVLSSKYQFNMYSYDSDLVLGAQFLRSKLTFVKKTSNTNDNNLTKNVLEVKPANEVDDKKGQYTPYNPYQLDQKHIIHKLSHMSQHNVVYKVSDKEYVENNTVPIKPDVQKIAEQKSNNDKSSHNLNDNDEYISSLKISGSFTKKTLRLAWEGKFHDWFVSSGASIDMKGLGLGPRVLKYGVEFSYNS